MSTTGPAGQLDGVLETCLYHDTAEAEDVERFYAELLGLALVSRWPDGMAFRAGAGVLLLFDRQRLDERDGPIARHGSSGPGHACLLATAPGELDAWRRRLETAGTEITHEHSWGDQRRSIYFADPAGNLLEIADGDLWPAARSEG